MAEFQNRWVSHLRSNARQESLHRSLSCPLCAADIQPDIEAFRAHVRADEPKHLALIADADIEEAFKKMALRTSKQRPESAPPKARAARSPRSPRRKPVSKQVEAKDDMTDRRKQDTKATPREFSTSASTPLRRMARSPPSSQAQASTSPTTPGRSQRRSAVVSDFDRGEAAKNTANRQLWGPQDEPKTRGSRTRPPGRRSRPDNRPSSMDQSDSLRYQAGPSTDLPFLQPETRPIDHEQLIHEIQGIYVGLVMVEKKCDELTNPARSGITAEQPLSAQQYQKLIALHRTLLHECHDFFLASQHPSASPAMRRLPAKYNMPARMWKHGIQAFLELLRKRLPESIESMLTFIYIAYSTLTLLYETVPTYIETWLECLGDLGRYRMAIEDDDLRDRDIWASVSRSWYSKASDISPSTGRLYHHLAILARPDALQQLFYFTKSLCVPSPFPNAADSIMTLFDPLLDPNADTRVDACEAAFVRVHGILFSGKCHDQLASYITEFIGSVDEHIAGKKKAWLHPGYCFAISLICCMFGYGAPTNPLRLSLPATKGESGDGTSQGKNATDKATAEERFQKATDFAMQTCDVIFQRKRDTNILPFFHVIMVFLHHVSQHQKAMSLIGHKFPWKSAVDILNEAYPVLISKPRIAHSGFPRPPSNEPLRPLAEDYALRGLLLSKDYFPADWFSSEKIEEDERFFELPSLADERRQRVLWLARQISRQGKWLSWDEDFCQFVVGAERDRDVDMLAED